MRNLRIVTDPQWVPDHSEHHMRGGAFRSAESGNLIFCHKEIFNDGECMQVLRKVLNALESGVQINYKVNVCPCSTCKSTYAYVLPNDSNHVVHLCDKFWEAKVKDEKDTRSGVLLHEISHFKDIAGTIDIQDGYDPHTKFAAHMMNDYQNNADSYELWFEELVFFGIPSKSQ